MKDTELYQQLLGVVKPWTVESVRLDQQALEIVVKVALRGSIGYTCPDCEAVVPGYDTVTRQWRHLDSCQFKTILEASLPRVECPEHGVKTIQPPWALKGSRFTALFERFAIDVLLLCGNRSQASELLKLSWKEVHGIMARAVERGLVRKDREEAPLGPIHVDEKAFKRGHKYVTVVSELREGDPCVCHVEPERKKESLDFFYAERLTDRQREGIEAVSMDMWEPFVLSTREWVPDADGKIVFDKFHIAKHLNGAVDQVRKDEHRVLKARNDDRLTGSKYLWLKNEFNLSASQKQAFSSLRQANLKTARAWAIKEQFKQFWEKQDKDKAEAFFRKWYGWAVRSRLQPIKEAARMLRDRIHLILNFHVHRITNALAEGINSRIQWLIASARGFRNVEGFIAAVYFYLGKLKLYPL
jgi:transposase